jgi:hypothetical protein
MRKEPLVSKRIALLLLVAGLVGALGVAPVAATPDQSPQALQFTEISCENGLVAGEFYVIGQGEAGHILELGVVGVAKSFFLLDDNGGVLSTFFDLPGKGLDKNTTWCTWQLDTPGGTLHFGADILFQGKYR